MRAEVVSLRWRRRLSTTPLAFRACACRRRNASPPPEAGSRPLSPLPTLSAASSGEPLLRICSSSMAPRRTTASLPCPFRGRALDNSSGRWRARSAVSNSPCWPRKARESSVFASSAGVSSPAFTCRLRSSAAVSASPAPWLRANFAANGRSAWASCCRMPLSISAASRLALSSRLIPLPCALSCTRCDSCRSCAVPAIPPRIARARMRSW